MSYSTYPMIIAMSVVVIIFAGLGFLLFYILFRACNVRSNLSSGLIFILIMLGIWGIKLLTEHILYAHTVIMYLQLALIGIPAGWVAFTVWNLVKAKGSQKV